MDCIGIAKIIRLAAFPSLESLLYLLHAGRVSIPIHIPGWVFVSPVILRSSWSILKKKFDHIQNYFWDNSTGGQVLGMEKVNILRPEEAAAQISDGAAVAVGGFVGCAHPEALTSALETRFVNERKPADLTLIYAAGQGDGKTRGLNHLAHRGLVRRIIGGHWNLAPGLGRLALDNEIEAYNFPQGVISHLFRDIANGNPGTITHIGLETFVDPRYSGGKLNSRTTEDMVTLVEIGGAEWLLYKSFPLDFAFLRGTASDSRGNISFEHEVVTLESTSIAQAVRNSGGKVFVQVDRMVDDYSRDPKSITIPGIYVDAVVLADEVDHMQTFREQYNPSYTLQGDTAGTELPVMGAGPRRYIARRAIEEVSPGSVVNLGIGMPEGVAQIAQELDRLDSMALTVESGPIGGIPAGGLSFGAAAFPDAIIDQPYQFDFYNGGGLDIAFLGFAECDKKGNVNVSKFAGRLAGIGGFMNISQTAGKVVFLGTFTSGGLETRFHDGKLEIVSEGRHTKFVEGVEHLTFNGPYVNNKGREVLYITERAVFRLVESGIELIEIAPGMDLSKDILDRMAFRPAISDHLKEIPDICYI